MLGEEILIEIDATLDRLIQNAEAIRGIDVQELMEVEIDAFQKTQESLLHRLIHMDELLACKRKSLGEINRKSAGYKIQEKRTRFEDLKKSYHAKFATVRAKSSILCKRRGKKLLNLCS